MLSWAAAIASVYTQALYQRSYMTLFDHIMVFVICIVAGAIMTDMGYALLGYVSSITIGMLTVFILTVVPVSSGNFNLLANELLNQLWITVLFKALFPFPFIAYLIGSLIGSGLGEKYFY